MQTNTKNTNTNDTGVHKGDCPPCEIPAFCRSYFYTGKLLTEGDLNRDQRCLIDKLRLHYIALHGWGVVCGLMVRPHPHCPDRFVVAPGLAVDDCGREVRVLNEYTKHFPEPPDPEAYSREDCREDEPPEPCEPEARTYYVCIRYKECQEDFMPVVFDECCGTSKKPNRVCEGYEIDLVEEAPECLEHIERRRRCTEEDWEELRSRLPESCPPTSRVCCIPLAIIHNYRYGEPLTEEMIENRVRPVLHSTDRLERMIHCLEERLPKTHERLTHIGRVNWKHDEEYIHHEFWREFVGGPENPRGFEVEFDRRVHPKSLNNRTFQAMIVREPEEQHEGRRIEIAPAHVLRSDDGKRCTLHMDREYAHHRLRDRDFDVFITLRCDKVVDEEGMLVDGVLRAALIRDEDRDYIVRFPTGNGSPGGVFESWIRVRRENGLRHEERSR